MYEIDRSHHYNEIEKSVGSIKKLVGPLYNVPHEHHFNEIGMKNYTFYYFLNHINRGILDFWVKLILKITLRVSLT